MAEATLPSDLSKVDPGDAWKPWQPAAGARDRKWRPTLYRRAAFGRDQAADLDKALADGPPKTLDRLEPTSEPDADDRLAAYRSRQVLQRHHQPPDVVALRDARKRAPGPREAHPLLAQPLRHQLRKSPQHEAHVRAERDDAQARAGQVPPVPARYEQGHGHVDLARFQSQCEGSGQRELRPRGDGALFPWSRQLHRKRHPGSRTGIHGLASRHGGRRSSSSTATCTTRARKPSSARPGSSTARTSSGSAARRTRVRSSSSANCTPTW